MQETTEEKMVKIIAVSGLPPREFIAKDNQVYIHEDEVREMINADGQVVNATYAVYEVPEDLAKFKLSEMPDRYKLYGTSKILRYPIVTPEGARSFVTAKPVSFKLLSKAIIDPETGEAKTKKGSKEIVFQKYYALVEKGNKAIDQKPYSIEVIPENEPAEKSDRN
jgi:hypothetical protein